MEQQNQNHNETARKSSAAEDRTTATALAATAPAAGTGEGASWDQLMAQSPALAPVGRWLKCLRKPAISLQYSFQKRHIPDLDVAQSAAQSAAQEAAQSAAQEATQSAAQEAAQSAAQGAAQSAAQGAETAGKGQNSDVMDVTGGATLRYFDLAAGVVGIMLLSCLWKGCCALKRAMKR